MLIRRKKEIPSSEITPYEVYLNRRHFIGHTARAAAVVAVAPGLVAACGTAEGSEDASTAGGSAAADPGAPMSAFRSDQERDWAEVRSELDEPLTPPEDVTSYTNFYESGTGKEDPVRNAGSLQTHPWSIEVEGLVGKPGTYALDDFIAPYPIEERVYRLRCVEAWSMVIPWMGFPLSNLIAAAEPTSQAAYVQFETLYDPDQMPGQRRRVIDWPYVEGLRLDEAMHPLAFMATGLYGRPLPNQNGAPIRLVVPWKYGFKSIKSIVRMRFVEDLPPTSWAQILPGEYGFYANVNPEVSHPRWSQARERRIGKFRKQPTLMFNGYADEVGHLYSGMDLARYY